MSDNKEHLEAMAFVCRNLKIGLMTVMSHLMIPPHQASEDGRELVHFINHPEDEETRDRVFNILIQMANDNRDNVSIKRTIGFLGGSLMHLMTAFERSLEEEGIEIKDIDVEDMPRVPGKKSESARELTSKLMVDVIDIEEHGTIAGAINAKLEELGLPPLPQELIDEMEQAVGDRDANAFSVTEHEDGHFELSVKEVTMPKEEEDDGSAVIEQLKKLFDRLEEI